MATANDSHDPKHHTASNWNVLRSRIVPSSVSGTHKAADAAVSASAVRVQTSDETLTIKARKSPAFYEGVESPTLKP